MLGAPMLVAEAMLVFVAYSPIPEVFAVRCVYPGDGAFFRVRPAAKVSPAPDLLF
jgi:hypothetical protein